MTEAGQHAKSVAQANGYWTIGDAVEDLIEDDDFATALDANPAVRTNWDGFSASRKKLSLWTLVTAAKPETRASRIAKIVDAAERGESLCSTTLGSTTV